MASYKGNAHLEQLLHHCGEKRSVEKIKDLLKGINAAPADIADPQGWLKLLHGKITVEAAEQLNALKDQIAAETPHVKQDRLADLRAEMAKRGIDGFFVPRADEFQGEYVPARADRLAWATHFTGSAGSAIVLKDKASFYTDGRYTLQARAQVDKKDFEIYSTSDAQSPTPTMTPTEWLEKNLPKGAKFGIDPWVHTPNSVKRIREAVEKAGGTLVFVDSNPLDAAWKDQPPAPLAPVVPQPLEFSGKASYDKRMELGKALATKGADAIALTLPEEICWLLNVRGGDVPCTPFALSYAIANKNGTVDWFIDQRKLTDDTKKWIGLDVRVHDLGEFKNYLAAFGKKGQTVWVDAASAPEMAQDVVKQSGGKVVADRSPIQLAKALKNKIEIDGMAACHIRDGAALTRYMAVLSEQGAAAKLDEMSGADLLESFRKEGEHFRGLSFDTISGAGGNGAIIHYRSQPETNQPILSGPVYLVDSGGQYRDGTTDVTRAIAVDNPTAEMKENFTRVLKGHIQVAMAVFPEGTCGDVLDVKARAALKEVGLDYAHGTGHGVGSHLSVHEGPCSISSMNKTVPLQAGMVLSNEPGYYKEGAYGIRIESLVAVVETGEKDDAGKKLLAFKTLTMAPIDRNLIDPSLMTADELKWLNNYHAEVRKNLMPLLEKKDPKAAAFLVKATEPVGKPAPNSSLRKINSFIL